MPVRSVRREYVSPPLRESGAPADPTALFARWLRAALRTGAPEPTAMTLATADARGRPSARLVLLKGADARGFVFFTHYTSRKGRELAGRPDAALVMWWPDLHRSVRIEGRVAPVPAAESDAYFATRPRGAQLGAWASRQSTRLADRAALERRLAQVTKRFAGREVERPPTWGGYRLHPRAIEFWQGRPDRLHDRLRYARRGGRWTLERLAP